ncbi:hypothetical protein WDW37_08945 [Bdellovibrionota bacterium FG-1]
MNPIHVFTWMVALLAFAPLSQAGQVRKIELTEDHPATVTLALGRSTAISFLSRPEKVVPGSPQAIQINFVGSDLTVTPVSRKPGNLLVYTKSARYVILFVIGGDSHYDDVVKVGTMGRGHPLRLLTDSFRLVSFKVVAKSQAGEPIGGIPRELTLRLMTNEREISGPDLDELWGLPGVMTGASKTKLHCEGCLVRINLRINQGGIRITCIKPIEKIHCESKTVGLDLERSVP